MNRRFTAVACVCLASLAALCPATAAWAAEGASTEYVGGFVAFADGYVPPDPGTYLTNYLYYYNGDTSP